jgi:hypothetical protein
MAFITYTDLGYLIEKINPNRYSAKAAEKTAKKICTNSSMLAYLHKLV